MRNDKKAPVTKRNYYLIEQGKTPYHVTESFRKIKAALSVSVPKHGKGGISIAFTSSYPEEGKTTVSVNLAATFAMSSNHKIVIVDTDIRKGLISKYFKQKSKPGLSEYLSGVATLDEVVKPSGVIENLSFIPCGSRSPKPYELLESDAMKELDKKLREEYDYVIYDTAPLLLFADAVAVGQICDGVAVICRHMVSYENELEKTLNTLKFANVNILGVIVNDFKLNEQLVGGSRHSKYYESGYEYYSTEDK